MFWRKVGDRSTEDALLLRQASQLTRDRLLGRTPSISPYELLPSPRAADAVRRLDDTPRLGALSMHYDGHVREAATRKLATLDATALPFLLLRLNDWVAPIRAIASAAIARRIETTDADTWLQWLPLVQRLQRQSRSDHAWVAAGVRAALRRRPSALRAALADSRRATRRFALAAAVEGERPALDAGELLRSSDEIVRIEGVRLASRTLDAEALCRTLKAARRDPFTNVRREAIVATLAADPDTADDVLRESLCDRRGSIRQLARYHLGPVGTASELSRVRRDLRGGVTSAADVRLLGELGDSSDVAVLETIGRSDDGVRRAAVAAMHRLAPDGRTEWFAAALADRSPGVSRAAGAALRRRVERPAVDELAALAEHAPHSHVRRNALRLLLSLPWWSVAGVVVRIARRGPKELSDLASDYLADPRRASTRLCVSPSAAQLASFRDALLGPGRISDEAIRRELDALAGAVL